MTITTERTHTIVTQPALRPGRLTRTIAVARRRLGAVAAAAERVRIGGQLGPNIGRPHDRWPEPPF